MKKLLSVGVSSLLALSMVTPVLASEVSTNAPNNNQSAEFGAAFGSEDAHSEIEKAEKEKAFQEIREKLSKEYGIVVREATKEELAEVGLSKSTIELTPEEFEAKTRESIEIVKAKNQKAESQSAAAGSVADKTVNHSKNDIGTQAVGTFSKLLDGGNAEATLTANLMKATYASWGDISNTVYYDYKAPFLKVNNWSYSYGIANRTVTIFFKGSYYDQQSNYLGEGYDVATFNASDY